MIATALLQLTLMTAPPMGWSGPPPEAGLERPHVQHHYVHAATAPRERGAGWVDRSTVPLEGQGGLTREVYAYLPYWELDYDEFRWDRMSTLAFFAANMNSDGDITNDHGWTGPTSQALRQEAAEHGVRYVLTVVNFNASSIKTLVNDPARRAHAIDVMLDAVISMDADGVNIDFEGVPTGAKAGLTAFTQETTAAFHAAIPGSHVTIATPAVDWNGVFDYDALAEASDGLMIMAYGYHWKGGNPGPISPVASGDVWWKYNLTWTIQDYIQWGKAENKHKFILGLPFYGRDWLSDGPDYPGDALADGVYEPFHGCKQRAEALGGFQWDDASSSTYFMEQKADGWHQVWCDDGASWLQKLALVTEHDLQGIGIWALGYERGTDDLWDAITAELVVQGPVDEPDPEDPSVEDPPVENPPVEDPPAQDPPVEDPAVEAPPVEDPPVGDPPPEHPEQTGGDPDPTPGLPAGVSGVNQLNGGTVQGNSGCVQAKDQPARSSGYGPVVVLLLLQLLGLFSLRSMRYISERYADL